MEIKSIYFLQPLVVEYEESGQLRESVILADMAREKIYQIVDYDSQFVHGNKELISKVKEIIVSKKNAQNANKIDSKSIESAIKKQTDTINSSIQDRQTYSK